MIFYLNQWEPKSNFKSFSQSRTQLSILRRLTLHMIRYVLLTIILTGVVLVNLLRTITEPCTLTSKMPPRDLISLPSASRVCQKKKLRPWNWMLCQNLSFGKLERRSASLMVSKSMSLKTDLWICSQLLMTDLLIWNLIFKIYKTETLWNSKNTELLYHHFTEWSIFLYYIYN